MPSNSGTGSGAGAALPLPLDLSHHFSQVAKNRNPSIIKSFYKYFAIPGIGQLAGGLPNLNYFPFDTLEAQVARPDRWTPTPNKPEDATGASEKLSAATVSDKSAASHMTVPKVVPEPDPLKKIDLSTALQYGTADGYPPLLSFLRQFTRENLHPNVPYRNGPEIILSCGSTDGFSKTADLIVNPWYADSDSPLDRPAVLCEDYVYSNAMSNVEPKGVRAVPVAIDAEGMMAEGPRGLRHVLENWDLRDGRRPHFMYTVTMGHNPTSGVLSVERRKAIYALCSKYDIIIVEDDPYWYLQFPSAAHAEARSRGLQAPPTSPSAQSPPAKSSGYAFLDSLVPSYLSVDVEGRVVRLDTFSKTIAPGCRLGWVTAQPAIIERLQRVSEVSTQQPSGFVQSMVAEVLMGPQPEALAAFSGLSRRERHDFNGWDTAGWVRWLEGLRGEYERRMGTMSSILDENAFQLKQSTPVHNADADWGVITKTRIMSFNWPRGGMFLWLRIHFENHPLWQTKTGSEVVPLLDGPVLSTALFVFCTRNPFKVLPGPGAMFSATSAIRAERGWAFFRLCFAAVDAEEIASCSHRFADAVQKFWRIKDAKLIEELYSEFTGTSMQEAQDLDFVGYGMGC